MPCITDIDKVDFLLALHTRALPAQGYQPSLSREGAEIWIGKKIFLNIVAGRTLKVNLHGITADATEYNRANGEGAFEEVVAKMRHPNSEDISQRKSQEILSHF